MRWSTMNFYIFGSGGHARVLHDVISDLYGNSAVRAFVEKDSYFESLMSPKEIEGVPILRENDVMMTKGGVGVIGVGQIKDSKTRQSIFRRLIKANFDVPPIIARTASVSRSASIADGAQVLSGAIVGPQVSIGIGSIVNTGSQIEHGTQIGNFCHISTGTILNGQVQIGDETFVGSGAVVSNGIAIGPRQFVKLGSKVVKDLI